MAKVFSYRRTQTCIYDFAVVGGAIGTYPMGIFFPANTLVVLATMQVLVAPNSGTGLHQISIGWTGNNTAITAAFAPGVAALNLVPDFTFINPVTPAAVEITFSISVDNLTQGRMIISIDGIEKTI